MQIELKGTSYPDILQMPVSNFEALVYADVWEKHIENDVQSARFEILIQAINSAATAITKTLAKGFEALAKTIAGSGR